MSIFDGLSLHEMSIFYVIISVMKILVTGGAGYIGGITARLLANNNHEVIVFDNLSVGSKVQTDFLKLPLSVGDLKNYADIEKALEGVESVIHFAARTEAGLSPNEPVSFFENNVTGSLNLLKAMAARNVDKLIFSSSSEVYGESEYLPLDEKHPLKPTNPYGWSKLMTEQMLPWFEKKYGLSSVALRYFNAGGAALDGTLGNPKVPPTLLVASAVRGALGLHDFKLSYTKVDTPDGSPIRDYVHVEDLARGHLMALDYLTMKKKSDFFNLGTGKGYSVLEVVRIIKKITGINFPAEIGARREGEPSAKYASFSKAKQVLGWEPKLDLEDIIDSELAWQKSHPEGWEKKA